MAQDFRELLKEVSRHERFGRWFEEINIQGMFTFSVQASDAHASIPPEILDDVYAYKAFELQLSQKTVSHIEATGYGAWDTFRKKDWAKRFERGYIAGVMEAPDVPTAVVQEIFEDLLKYAAEHRM